VARLNATYVPPENTPNILTPAHAPSVHVVPILTRLVPQSASHVSLEKSSQKAARPSATSVLQENSVKRVTPAHAASVSAVPTLTPQALKFASNVRSEQSSRKVARLNVSNVL
jgi:hypothetical protein